eukprot:CAMPEP_0182918210 /NCGR_PEP_ID=MMETSP0105_2-20130417/1954_1 /TAXON_ID=81532 ORGANISM="Acanthoeca-like sp., Strain 10tr" /NCGR_SAMPLE_ID=MMETSP0105_2 /ASSEMBLY_ACC=CAM_ASM_000205 /LENGTH=169 /DNA_ID=CAMNT_0025055271 /DNA_START=41 /DNA_END=550 /DNA_ORIENTATION=+
MTRRPSWPRGYIIPFLACALALFFAIREGETRALTRAAAVLAILLTGCTFVEDTQQCDVHTGGDARVVVTRTGPFDWLMGADGVKVFPGRVISVTVAAERLRYFTDGYQVRLELDDCLVEVMVTGSITLDPVEEHMAVAKAICKHCGLDPEHDLIVEKVENKATKLHSH